jgi:hypothetical protein
MAGCDRSTDEPAVHSVSGAPPAEVTLDADSAFRFADPFTTVAGLRELSDGRVLISDRTEKRVFLVDLSAGSRTVVGREGRGPEEYAIPGRLFALSGDTTLLVDEGLQRLAVIPPEGRIGSTFRVPGGVAATRLGGVGPAGRLFFEGSPPGAGAPDAPGAADSVPVVRWARGDVAVDTVATVRTPPLASVTLGDPAAGSVSRIAFPQPFGPGDAWGVAPAGELVIVRTEPFRMERFAADGKRLSAGPEIRRPTVVLTEEDREAFPFGPEAAKAISWPTTKPPFRYGMLRVASGGDVWIELSTPAAESDPLYGVLRPDGSLHRLVRLPQGRRFVGSGQGTVYTTWKDDDGLEWVERYAF